MCGRDGFLGDWAMVEHIIDGDIWRTLGQILAQLAVAGTLIMIYAWEETESCCSSNGLDAL